ncbi:MAG: retroviral-like aspartic protease family protein [Deltaproteobacteria bacterium]|nr:retroviral-like aspartic protease family protein [Deltaproteobacteria bacterium]
MGLTHIKARLFSNPPSRKTKNIQFLVDSGAVYSVLPEKVWRSLGLKPMREVEFTLADGTVISRSISECSFKVQGKKGTSPVVLGASEDAALLGMVTLEVLGLMINPLSRELLPMKLVLARVK